TEELSTTAPAATTTTATPTIATTIANYKTEGKKLVEPMLLLHQKTVGMSEISLCARDAVSIILDLVLANVIFATRRGVVFSGLEYLHHGCKSRIVHRDIKFTNILLNGSFQEKIADFGSSKVFLTEGGTHISTVVASTPGYLDPERVSLLLQVKLIFTCSRSFSFRKRYYTTNGLTKKSDVYSFRVVILVLITSQPAITRYENENIHIIRWVNLMLADGNVKIIVDPRQTGDFDINSAWKLVELAMACVDQIPSKRPTMNEVAMELNDCLCGN
ncbi:putative leucine-rich repeat receptor-like protein kinase, partial [Tanacetum coccineum]